MSVLLFWLGYIAAVVVFMHSPLARITLRLLDAEDGEPYYPPTRSARAAVEAKRVPEPDTTTRQEADQ